MLGLMSTDPAPTTPPARAQRPIDFDHNLSYHLTSTVNLTTTWTVRQICRRFGLNVREWRVLAILGSYAPLCARDIVARTGMDKATVSRAVAALERAGLLASDRDRRDKRRTRLWLSPEGAALHDRITPISEDFYARFDAGLSKDERAALLALLKKLRHHAASVLDQPEDAPHELS